MTIEDFQRAVTENGVSYKEFFTVMDIAFFMVFLSDIIGGYH